MKNRLRKALLICSFAPLLMSVLCERQDDFSVAVMNKTNVTLSESANFTINDTLWVSGIVSSMVFDEGVGDSIMNTNEWSEDIISVLRLKTANVNSNTIEAINEFKLVTRIGSNDFLGACPESELIAVAPLTDNGQNYKYELGLVPEKSGDFVLSWLKPVNLKNSNLNIEILENYPVNGSNNSLGLTKCGITSAIFDVKESKRSFFFSVN